jgi:hypothetical protein
MLNISIPANQKVLQYLALRNRTAPLLAAANSTPDPYFGLSSHPEIVEHLWKNLGRSLPLNCCWIVRGTPALVHPGSGVVLAFALGTQYVLRLPPDSAAEAVILGARVTTTWAGGQTTDISRELGAEWVFGRFLPQEPEWVNRAFKDFGGLD